MSDVWDEVSRRADVWYSRNDRERPRLLELFEQAMRFRETDPDRQFDLLTKARDEAQRLAEPWWILFFEKWRLDSICAGKHDFKRALPLAIELMTRFSGPEGNSHPFRDSIMALVLYVYAELDPFGYRDEIERGAEVLRARNDSSGDVENSLVSNYRQASYLIQTERLGEAYELAHQSLDIANYRQDPWHGTWALFLLCRICHALQLPDEIATHSDVMVEQSSGVQNRLRTLADGWLWRAYAQLHKGDRKKASRSFQNGMRHLERVERRDEISAEPIATYYELLGNVKAAIGVREREIRDLMKSGSHHRAAIAHIERCRLLKLIGEITEDDIYRARDAATLLWQPTRYFEKLDRILASEAPPTAG